MISKKFKVPVAFFPKVSRSDARNAYFSLKSAENNLLYSRLGITFRAKAIKTAVERNRLKRIIFDFFGAREASSARNRERGLGRDYLIIINPPMQALESKKIIDLLKNERFI